MATKTYELLPNMEAAAPVYQSLPDGKREQVRKIPFHRPTLRQTFQDENGKSKTIRFKEVCETIDQNKQILEEKIPANDPFTTTEREALMFRYGSLTTDNLTAQAYLEAHPEFLGFKGKCADVREPRYKLVDEVAEAKTKNSDVRLRVNAAKKVLDMESLDELQSLIIRLNGAHVKPPNSVEDCQNDLMDFIDDAEEAGLKAVLKEEKDASVDEQTRVLLTKLINADLISFDAVVGVISKKDKDGKWAAVRQMSNEYPVEERMRLFSDWLNTEDGKPLKLDLEKDAKKIKK